jgi:hypothetical protein
MSRKVKEQSPRCLIYDLETSYMITKTWGVYDQNVIGAGKGVITETKILCFAYKWLGDKKTYVVAQPDFKGYKPGINDDTHVVKKLWELFNEAEIVMGHNSKSFDDKISLARMIYHKLPPVSPFQQIDTKQMAKSRFKFTTNKLADIADYFGVEAKGDPGGMSTWDGCIAGDPKAWKRMCKYNKQDVIVTEQIYTRMLGWANNHPNMANITGRPDACPKCGVEGFLWAQGIRYTKTGQYRRWQCKSCGSYVSNRQQEKTERPKYV